VEKAFALINPVNRFAGRTLCPFEAIDWSSELANTVTAADMDGFDGIDGVDEVNGVNGVNGVNEVNGVAIDINDDLDMGKGPEISEGEWEDEAPRTLTPPFAKAAFDTAFIVPIGIALLLWLLLELGWLLVGLGGLLGAILQCDPLPPPPWISLI